jgi:peptidoglycan glycosyltransferase
MLKKRYFLFLAIIIVVTIIVGKQRRKVARTDDTKNKKVFIAVKDVISENFSKEGIDWKNTATIEGEKLDLEFTFNKDLEDRIQKILKRYYSAYTSVVVINNDTGEIEAAVDYQKRDRKFSRSLSFSSTNPAASLFKIITAARLLEKGDLEPETEMEFRGRSTTLYKYQLKDPKRYIRRISFQKAFAYSNNVIFGKAAVDNLTASGIFEMAERFGFNQELLKEVSSGISKFPLAENQYNLAELASGFNKETLISPVHAAMLGSIIANDGVFKQAHLLKEIRKADRSIWKFKEKERRVLEKDTAKELQQLMELTVKRGTARRLFYTMRRKWRNRLSLGAKTGSITGGVPYGKRDWVVVYAKPNEPGLPSISVAVMIVNLKKWYIKSTALAKKIIEYYYRAVDKNLKAGESG